MLYDAEEMTNDLFPLKNTYTHKKEVEKGKLNPKLTRTNQVKIDLLPVPLYS
jgi:hypothetical protein